MINPLLRPSQARPNIEFFKNSVNEWCWQITHPVNMITGHSSGGFKTKRDCIHNLIKTLINIHETCDEELKKGSEP